VLVLLLFHTNLCHAQADHTGNFEVEAGSGEDGDVIIEGDVSAQGNVELKGSVDLLNASGATGYSQIYQENGGYFDLYFWGFHQDLAFSWVIEDPQNQGQGLSKMSLDKNNVLSIYNPSGSSAKIVLTPSDSQSSILIDDMPVAVVGGSYAPDDFFGDAWGLVSGTGASDNGFSNVLVFGAGAEASAEGQVVLGNYNEKSSLQAFQVGGGTGDTERFNAFTVDSDGDARVNGNLYVAKNSVVDGTLYVKETGGLSMGAFKEGAQYGFSDELESYIAEIQAGYGEVPDKIRLEQLESIVNFLKTEEVGGISLWSRTRFCIANSKYNAGSGGVIYALGGLSNDHFTISGGGLWSGTGVLMSLYGSVWLANPGALDEHNRTVMLSGEIARGKPGGPTCVWRHGGFTNQLDNHAYGKVRWFLSATASNGDFKWTANGSLPDMTEETVLTMKFTADGTGADGTAKIWNNSTLILDDNTETPSEIYATSLDIVAYQYKPRWSDSGYVPTADESEGNFRYFLYSDLNWTEAQAQQFQALISNLDWQ